MASNHSSHPMALYNDFDSIIEPGRRPQPMFMRRAKTRRSKTAVTLAVCCVLLLIWGWRSSGIGIIPTPSRFSSNQLSYPPQIALAPELASDAEAPLTAPPAKINSTPIGFSKTNPAFHLLMPASESNTDLCKTLLSAFVLSYPPPTLVNYGKTFEGSGWDKGSHAGKIRGVYDFLNDEAKVKDDDLVLIIDGYDAWFQLPPDVMIRRYRTMVREGNERLRRRYGMVTSAKQGEAGALGREQRYTQKVIFGADKICWPNPAEDPACAAVPYSTLSKDIYGPETDKDSKAFTNRPRYLNSGTVIGPAADVRAIYKYAVKKVEEKGRGEIGDQFVFAEIFGEQEYQRETLRRSSQGIDGRFYDWLSNTLGTSESPLSANITINNMTAIPGQSYEYSLGLDYESTIFQTMTHSAADIEYITYNSSAFLSSIQAAHPSLHGLPFFLPQDLQTANAPFSYVSPGNHTLDSTAKKGLLLPYSANLDALPGQEPGQQALEPTWHTLPLATNIYAASIPALLHINGDKTLLASWWDKMWFYPYSRALLRRYVRSTQGATAAAAAERGGTRWWDSRGGRGGVWTDNSEWMGWGEICEGCEEEVFGDGKGTWGREEGDPKVVNPFGKVIIGDDEE